MEDDTESLSPPILLRLTEELSDVEEFFEDPPDLDMIQDFDDIGVTCFVNLDVIKINHIGSVADILKSDSYLPELIAFDEQPESKLDRQTDFASGNVDIALREARRKLTKTTDFKQIKGWQQKFGHLLNQLSQSQPSTVEIEEKIKEVQETYSSSMPSVISVIAENVQISSILAAKETEEIPSMDMTLFYDSYDEIMVREEKYEANYDVPGNVEMPTVECGQQFCRLGCVCDSLKTVINRPKLSLEHSKINWSRVRRRRERKVPGRYFSSDQIVFTTSKSPPIPSIFDNMTKMAVPSTSTIFTKSPGLSISNLSVNNAAISSPESSTRDDIFPKIFSAEVSSVTSSSGSLIKSLKINFSGIVDLPTNRAIMLLPLHNCDDEWCLVSIDHIPDVGLKIPGLTVFIPAKDLERAASSTAMEHKVRVSFPVQGNNDTGSVFIKGFGVYRTPQLPRHVFLGPFPSKYLAQCLPLQSCLIPISLTNYSSLPAEESSVKVNNTKESELSAESSDEISYMDVINLSSDDDEISVVATVVKSVSPEIEIVYDKTSCFSQSLTTVNPSENGSEKAKENTDAAECFIRNSDDSEDEIDVCGLSQEESPNSTSSVTKRMEKMCQTEKAASKPKQSQNNYSSSIQKRSSFHTSSKRISAQQLLHIQQERERRRLLGKLVRDLDSLLVPECGSRRGQIAILNHATSTIKSLQSEAKEMENTYRELNGRRTTLLKTRERRFYGLPTEVRQMFNCLTDSLALPIRHLKVSETPS